MKKLVILFIAIICSLSSIGADISYYNSIIEKGNTLYEENQWDEALQQYKSVYDAGYVAPGLFYNMANTYYKLNQFPEAILFYEKALKLDPNDADAKFNLAIANEQIVDEIEPLPTLFYENWIKAFENTFSSDGWALFSVIFFWITTATVLFYLLTRSVLVKKLTFLSSILTVIFIGLGLWLAVKQHNRITKTKSAIIFNEVVNVMSEPSDKSTRLFVVHEGLKVNVLDQLNGWYKVSLQNGSIGWIPEDASQSI